MYMFMYIFAHVQGFIDCHVHITGGGGELGPESRCPEARLSELIDAGITTVFRVVLVRYLT